MTKRNTTYMVKQVLDHAYDSEEGPCGKIIENNTKNVGLLLVDGSGVWGCSQQDSSQPLRGPAP